LRSILKRRVRPLGAPNKAKIVVIDHAADRPAVKMSNPYVRMNLLLSWIY